MRYKDLIQESLIGSEGNVQDMIQTIIMSMSAQDMGEIPTATIAQELKTKMNIDVPYGELMQMLSQMPLVDTSDQDTVTIRGHSDTSIEGEESSQEQVAQMATNGVSARKDF